VSRLSQDLLTPEELLYGLIPKAALSEALLMDFSGEGASEDDETESKHEREIRQLLTSLNKRATEKAFKHGVGALQDELWRLCHEEGVMIENEERQVTELLTRDFIQL